jgi:enoyl-[acyl-carrier protein] reductase II
MLTKESMVHNNFKQLCLKATEQDTLYSNVFDGMPGRVMKTPAAEKMMKSGFPLVESFKGAKEVKELLKLSTWQFIAMGFKMMTMDEGSPLWVLARSAVGNRRHMKALVDGDVQEGILFAGQDIGGINDVPTVKELMDRIVAEAKAQTDKIEKSWV